ncbi:MAG: hypothetical protein V3U16_00840 [Candidatus Neomarinimicrobiota bacterium]
MVSYLIIWKDFTNNGHGFYGDHEIHPDGAAANSISVDKNKERYNYWG